MNPAKRQFRPFHAIVLCTVLVSATVLIALFAADKPEQDEFERHLKMLDNDYYKSKESREACQYFCKLLDGEDKEAIKEKLLLAVDLPDLSDRQRFGIYKILQEHFRDIINYSYLSRYHCYDFFKLVVQFESARQLQELFRLVRRDSLLDPLLMYTFEKREQDLRAMYDAIPKAEVDYIMFCQVKRKVGVSSWSPEFVTRFLDFFNSKDPHKQSDRDKRFDCYSALVCLADRDERAWQIVKAEMERILKEGDQKAFDGIIGLLEGGACIRALPFLTEGMWGGYVLYPDHRVLLFLLRKQIAEDPKTGVHSTLDSIMKGWLGTDLRAKLEWYRENADYLRNIEYKNPHFVIADFEKMVSEINRNNYKTKIEEIRTMFNYRREVKIPGSKVFKYVHNDLMEWWRTNGRLHMWDDSKGKYFVFDIAYDIEQLCAMSSGDARDKAVEAFFKQFEGSVFRAYPIDRGQVAKDPKTLEKWWQGVNQDYLYVSHWYADDRCYFDREKFPPRVFCDVHAYKNKIPAAIWQKIPWKARDSWKTISEDDRKKHIDKINADNAAEKALTEQARAHKIAVCIWRHIDEKARAKWDKLSAEEREKHLCAAEEILLNPPFEVRVEEKKTKSADPDKKTP